MKKVFEIIKKIFMTNMVAIIGVAILSVIIDILCNINFILAFFVLIIAYFVLGFTIESAMYKYRVNKRRKSGKTAEEIKKEAEIRAERRAKGEALMRQHKMESCKSSMDSGNIGSNGGNSGNGNNFRTVVPSKERTDYLRGSISTRRTPCDVEPPSADVDLKERMRLKN